MKIKILLFFIIYICFQTLSHGQQKDKPKLIVGIVVDQMRADYLYRFQDNYSENGFKRLLREGYNVKNTHYNYIPTATGPGHASIYTGTTPANHGIVGNVQKSVIVYHPRRIKVNHPCRVKVSHLRRPKVNH